MFVFLVAWCDGGGRRETVGKEKWTVRGGEREGESEGQRKT